jgi:ParB-like chromosome segregation protein Spo0J
MEIVDVPIDALLPHPKNPRKGNVDKIAESIIANGFYGAVIAQKSTNIILVGNHRWRAARQTGMTSIPVMYVDVDDATATKILLADNRTSDLAVYDADELTRILKSVMVEDDLTGTGFTAQDLDKMIADVNDAANYKRVRNLEPFQNCYWLIKAPIEMQGELTDAFQQAIAKREGVEIVTANN